MTHKSPLLITLIGLCAVLCSSTAVADWIELRDGTRIDNCFIRDEGPRLLVWEKMADVGTDKVRVIGRHELKPVREPFKIERDASVWDAKPKLADLSVTHIEMNPKLPSLHGVIDYDNQGRPTIRSVGPLKDIGDQKYLHPERIAEDVDFQYKPGQKITLTSHVKNLGFKAAQPFSYVWKIDGKTAAKGECKETLDEMGETTFELKWKWEKGFHTATFEIVTDQDEIATINNTIEDPLWGFSFYYVVSKGRVDAWHQFRSGYGTFSFEDFYRWHIDIMNLMLEKSIYPATPDGCKARVRLDRIIYADKVMNNTIYVDGKTVSILDKDGLHRDQGGWYWNDQPTELETGMWIQVNPDWRNRTEWSLPHELGHQLGLVDWYALDYPGGDRHVWPDTGEKFERMFDHPVMMMHWHGPQVFGEVDSAYLSENYNQPRGYFGEMYFAMPKECYVKVVDINGQAMEGVTIEFFQRGAKVDPNGKPTKTHNVTYYPVIEDGDYYSEAVQQVTATPVIVGKTNDDGMIHLPNRPVARVKTLCGLERRPNPFGNVNVVGQRAGMLAKIEQNGRVCYYYFDAHEFVGAYYRGQKDRYTLTLKTPFASVDSPLPPSDVRVEKIADKQYKVTWKRPEVGDFNYTYLQRPIGYRVYARVGNSGLNELPWFVVKGGGPETFEAIVDLSERPDDTYWGKQRLRFGVTTLGETSIQSELVETFLKE